MLTMVILFHAKVEPGVGREEYGVLASSSGD